MVNIVDTEKLMKNLVTQFCDQNFKFTSNLKILGSIHVITDNIEVLTCLLNEKFFKSPHARGLLQNNPNVFNQQNQINQILGAKSNTNPANQNPLMGNTDAALNLVTTLNQLQQHQQQQLKLNNPGLLNGKNSLSSSSSTASSSSTKSHSSSSSSSSYSLDSGKHGKRKRFQQMANGPNGTNGNADDASSSASSSSNPKLNQNTDEDEDDDDASSDHNNENANHGHEEMDNDIDYNHDDQLNSSRSAAQTPVKRNKLDENSDEAAAAAAATLSLISAAAVASKLLNQQNGQYKNMNGSAQAGEHLNEGMGVGNHEKKRIKAKAKKIKDELSEHAVNGIQHNGLNGAVNNNNNNMGNGNEDEDSGSEDNQLYMDEDNLNNENENNENENGPSSSSTAGSSGANVDLQKQQQQHQTQQQQQHTQHQQLMMAAAAAIMQNQNNNSNGENNANKLNLFMPHANLALNLAVQQQQQQLQQQQNLTKKKKQKQSLMSPSSSSSTTSANSINLGNLVAPNSNKSTSSASSTTSTTGKNKTRRKTIAAMAAAANSPGAQAINPNASADLQRNLVALATQFGLKDTSNFDKIIHEMNANNEKSKLLMTHTPNPTNGTVKHIKKQHLLAASLNNTPNTLPVQIPQKPAKTSQKKKSVNGHFQDSSNLLPTNPLNTNGNNAVAAAAAAALQYHFLNNTNNLMTKSLSTTPQKALLNGKYRLPNGNGYYPNNEDMDEENNRGGYDDEGEEEYDMKTDNYDEEGMPKMNGVPLAQSNTNSASASQAPLMNANMEFECTACEKKFKYYCYYKRHMDACHSEWPKYVCDTCNKSYKWEASFRQHLRSHHGVTGPANGENMENGEGKMNQPGNENNEYSEDDANGENMMDEQNENYNNADEKRMNESACNESATDIKDTSALRENNNENEPIDEEDADIDSQELDIEQQINQSQNEPKTNYMGERDTEQMGAAGALASIAESIQNNCIMVNNRDGS